VIRPDAAERRRGLKVKVVRLNDDHDAFDREYFAALSPADRIAMAEER
jgi:hypothetical protein